MRAPGLSPEELDNVPPVEAEVPLNTSMYEAESPLPNLYDGVVALDGAKELGRSVLRLSLDWWRFGLDVGESLGLPHAIAEKQRTLADATEELADFYVSPAKPEWDLDPVEINGRLTNIKPEVVDGTSTPFARVVHFQPEQNGEAIEYQNAGVLVVGPLSGHFSTLVKDTVQQLVPDHDTYIVEWNDAKEVPVEAGRFGLSEKADHVQQYIKHLGPDINVLAICQSTVPVLMAVSRLAEDEPESQPATMTLMAGPIDPGAAPTEVTRLAQEKPLSWFKGLIQTVPDIYPGAGRRVYPGFTQLMAFINMGPERHVGQPFARFRHRIEGNDDLADKITSFYNEYFAVLDMPEEFYLETVHKVFQERQLAKGTMHYNGRLVDLSKITAPLLTVEGEKDDISAPGQTLAAQHLCTGIDPSQRGHHVEPEAGHYGVFSGKRWKTGIKPVVAEFIRKHAK